MTASPDDIQTLRLSKLLMPIVEDVNARVALIRKLNTVQGKKEVGDAIEKYNAYQAGGMSKLLDNKINKESYTGFSLINWINSLFYPTEQALREAMVVYETLNNKKIIKFEDSIKGMNEILEKKIGEYKISKQIKENSDNYVLLNNLHIALQKKLGKYTGENLYTSEDIMNSVSFFLLQDDNKNRTDLDCVRVVYSKICAINSDLGDSWKFDYRLTRGTQTPAGYVLSCVEWFLNKMKSTTTSANDVVNSALNEVAESVNPRYLRIDTLISDAIEKDNAEREAGTPNKVRTEELKTLYTMHEISKAFDGEGDANWYDVYDKLYEKQIIEKKATQSMLSSMFSSFKLPGSPAKNPLNLLNRIETSTVSNPHAAMHKLYDKLRSQDQI